MTSEVAPEASQPDPDRPGVAHGEDGVAQTFAVVRDLLDADDAAENPALLEHAAHLLINAAAHLPVNPSSRPTGPALTPAVVSRAVAFIHANAEHDITTHEIAAAAGIGVRALQIAFKNHLNQTPTAYLRGVRIACAHRDLQTSDSTGIATVTSIAKRWQFHHPGRFSEAYRQVYGNTPSMTLRA